MWWVYRKSNKTRDILYNNVAIKELELKLDNLVKRSEYLIYCNNFGKRGRIATGVTMGGYMIGIAYTYEYPDVYNCVMRSIQLPSVPVKYAAEKYLINEEKNTAEIFIKYRVYSSDNTGDYETEIKRYVCITNGENPSATETEVKTISSGEWIKYR